MAEEETREKEQQGEKGVAEIENGEVDKDTKKRSKTELDLEGIDLSEAPQEGGEKDETADKQEEKFQKKRISKREYILVVFAVLLILIMASGSVFIWARYFASDEEGLALSVPQGPVYELKPFLVPLNTKAESKKFMRLTLVLELDDESSYKKITKRIEEVRGNVFKILVKVSPKKIEYPDEKKDLAEKIISTINLLLAKNTVRNVFFKDMLVI